LHYCPVAMNSSVQRRASARAPRAFPPPFAALVLEATALLASVAAAPSMAAAQATQISADLAVESITGRDGNALTDLVNNPIGTEECNAGADFVISMRLQNIPTDKSLLDFWRASAGTDCSQPSNRDMTSGGTPPCTHLNVDADTTTGGASIKTISTSLANLFDTANEEPENQVCTADGSEDGKYNIYILAVNAAATNEAAGKAWFINATLDTQAPAAPLGTSGGSGDTEISVSWDNSGENLKEQRVYYLKGGCSGGVYGGATGDGSADASDNDGGTAGDWTKAKDVSASSTQTTLTGSSIGLAYGDEAAVAVSAIDLAGNESPLSTPACIQRVSTDGFCDKHVAEGGKCESCAVRAPTRDGGLPWMVAALALGLARVVRRRR
jgi:MYXO-CTERM domain-containing protein